MTLGVSRTATQAALAPRARPAALVQRYYLLALLLAVLAAVMLVIDLPVAQLCRWLQDHGRGDVRKALQLFEAAAHGVGVAMILVVVAVLDPSRRWQVPRLALCAYGAGVVNLGFKLLIGRSRPQYFLPGELPQQVHETFVGFAPSLFGSPEGSLAHAIQSFPSGHSATAAGLAAGLAFLYPHGRWLFATVAFFAMLQRVECGAHYPSDTLAGAAVGVTIAAVCCDPRFVGRWLDRLRPSPSSAGAVTTR